MRSTASGQLLKGLCVLGVVGLASVGTLAVQAPPAAAPAQAPSRDGAPVPGPAASPDGRGRAGQPVAPPPSQASIDRATAILADARKALGGAKLDAVKTVVATGRTRRLRGSNIQPIEFEMSIELPDKYLRKDEFPAEESDPTSAGFNGADLIQLPVPPAPVAPAGRPGGPPPPSPADLQARAEAQRRARVTTLKQDFVRFALGLFPGNFETFPLTFAFAAQAEAPQGKADVLDAKGPGGFAARLFLTADTHVPIMVSWQAPPTSVVVVTPDQTTKPSVGPGVVIVTAPASPASSATAAEKETYAKAVNDLKAKAQATPVEQRLYFRDYRDVDGVQLPFGFRRAIGADTTEETTIDRYRLNTKIDPKKFAVVK